MPREFERGDRVQWSGRAATVNYRRNGAPDYKRAVAYSILLDDVCRPDYAGTIVPANEVNTLEERQR
jgi:hypothetical protein